VPAGLLRDTDDDVVADEEGEIDTLTRLDPVIEVEAEIERVYEGERDEDCEPDVDFVTMMVADDETELVGDTELIGETEKAALDDGDPDFLLVLDITADTDRIVALELPLGPVEWDAQKELTEDADIEAVRDADDVAILDDELLIVPDEVPEEFTDTDEEDVDVLVRDIPLLIVLITEVEGVEVMSGVWVCACTVILWLAVGVTLPVIDAWILTEDTRKKVYLDYGLIVS
jgi:hypothetical protein